MMPGFGEMPAGVLVFVCYAGPDGDDARTALEPMLGIGTVVDNGVQEKAYGEILEEAHPPPGVRAVVSNRLMPDLSDDVISDIDAVYAGGSAGRVVFVRGLGGAYGRVDAEATAFPHRDAEAMVVFAAFLPLTASDEDVATALKPWRPIAAAGSGAYAGFLGQSSEEDLAALFPKGTMARLVEVKREYDPDNLFSQNFNVVPG
jgi:hypothetical protein